jgi:hypothetical protein
MCSPTIFLGAKAIAATATAVAVPATAGLFGSAGLFGWGAALSTLGTVFSVISAVSSGRQQQAQYDQTAAIADYNVKVEENNAIASEQAALYEADVFDDKVRRLMGRQSTAFAKSGVVINQDTPLEVSVADAEDAAVERLAILYQGNVAAEASRAGARGQQFRADAARANARATGTATMINVGGAFARGVSSHSRRYGSLLG